MDILSFLKESTGRFGPVGYEQALAKWLKEQFEPLCDEVHIDAFSNVIAVKKPTLKPAGGAAPPKIMYVAHMDEVALLVTAIEKDGSLRVRGMGGVDPKIFPAATVTVHTETGGLFGVIGAKPPHLLTEDDRKKAVKFDDLYIDLGMAADAVKAKVSIGDMVTFHGGMVELLNGRAASKTMDDRSCIAVMLDAAQRLQKLQHAAEVIFCCSTQEEVGGYGAKVGAYSVDPDIGFVLDVTFANYPGAKPDSTVPLDAPVWLRALTDDDKLRFQYSLNGEEFTGLGPALDLTYLSDEAGPYGKFTGTYMGMFAQDSDRKAVWAEFGWFEYRVLS